MATKLGSGAKLGACAPGSGLKPPLNVDLYRAKLTNTVQNYFCQNFIKCLPVSVIFGKRVAKKLKLHVRCTYFLPCPDQMRSLYRANLLNAATGKVTTRLAVSSRCRVCDEIVLYALDLWHNSATGIIRASGPNKIESKIHLQRTSTKVFNASK